jgi:primosomal protein N' (replication factor Y)
MRRVVAPPIAAAGADPVPPNASAPVELPVAEVVLEVPLAHLDHTFDYAVPAALAADAVPGSRVRVRFAGRLVSGFVVARSAASAHPGRLSPLSTVVSPEPVLSPDILATARRVAARCAGTTADVLRLAVPPRHARVEAEPVTATGGIPAAPASDPGPWGAYAGGAAFLDRVGGGDGPRAVLAALPGDLAGLVAAAVGHTLEAGRGSVVVVPDVRDLDLFDGALTAALGPGRHVVLTAELGPAIRYRRWLAVRRGQVQVVLGTRAAAFAPVADPGLFVCYDDGDDLLAEPRAPYCHARDVLAIRATQRGGPPGAATGRAGLLLAGHAVSAAGAALVRSGFAHSLAAPRELVRVRTPRVVVAGADVELARDPAGGGARVPGLVLRTVRDALVGGPVLVQTPRAGYRPYLTCERCREPARCPACAGPLAQAGAGAPPTCRWCGRPAADHLCPTCGATRFRSRTVGSMRTAEELGRAFPGVPVLLSGGVSAGAEVPVVPDGPALVIATPGAEPQAPSGYAAAALLDGTVALDRPELAAAEEAARRWFGAAALVRAGAPVVLVAPADQRAVQALVRWDPFGFADAEFADRLAARLPPAAVVAELTGAAADLADLLARIELPPGADVLGPVPLEPDRSPGSPSTGVDPAAVRAIVRVGPGGGSGLTDALRLGQAARSVRKLGAHVRIRIDPVDLG